MSTAIVLLGHGSKAKGALESMHRVADWIGERYGVHSMLVCQMDPPGMTLSEGVAAFALQGFEQVLVLPYFLHFGNHLREDIPALIKEANALHPGVDVRLGRHLGADPALADLVHRRLQESLSAWDDLETVSA